MASSTEHGERSRSPNEQHTKHDYRESALDAGSVGRQTVDASHSALHSTSQGAYRFYGGKSGAVSPARYFGSQSDFSYNNRFQTTDAGSGSPIHQSSRPRPTPASSFSALFPPPQAVASVTTENQVYPSNPNQGGSLQQSLAYSSSTAPSRRSPFLSDRYHPYTQSAASSAPPSLSHSASSASHSLVSSTPSSRAVSTSGFASPYNIPHSPTSFPTSSQISSRPPLSASGLKAWPPSAHSTPQPAESSINRPSSGSNLVLPLYSGTHHRASSSFSDSRPPLNPVAASPPYYTFEGEQEEDIKFSDVSGSHQNKFSGFTGKQESQASSPSFFGHEVGQPVASISQQTNSIPAAIGTAATSTSEFGRDLPGLAKGVNTGTRGLLVPYTSQEHRLYLDRQRSSYATGHQNNHQPTYAGSDPSSYRVTTMSGNMYHGDLNPLDSYEDEDILGNVPEGSGYDNGGGFSMEVAGSSNKRDDKQVRRRSSKACDQCRKSKCKCERSGDGDSCKSCVMLGTACTFLGPSRKRGPPKGYIDAIESRLHQTEALVGILLALANPERGLLDDEDPVPDERAKSLIEDLRDNDLLAREIVDRVDRGAYGTKGRRSDATLSADAKRLSRRSVSGSADENANDSGGTVKEGSRALSSGGTSGMGAPPPSIQGRGRMVGLGQEIEMNGLATAHPSNEWQDAVTERLKAAARSRFSNATEATDAGRSSQVLGTDGFERERQRRRVDSPGTERSSEHATYSQAGHKHSLSSASRSSEPSNTLTVATSAARYSPPAVGSFASSSYATAGPPPSSSSSRSSYIDSSADEPEHVEGEEGITGGVGQLSINEDAQVRFHGKASGLHLLGQKQRVDGRNKGGIWHFPKARVWPPVSSKSSLYLAKAQEAEAFERAARARFPPRDVQEHLLQLYFIHVHPFLPIVHKRTFLQDFKKMHEEESGKEAPKSGPSTGQSTQSATENIMQEGQPKESNQNTESTVIGGGASGNGTSTSSPRIPTLLLLVMFAISARYAPVAHGTGASPHQVLLESSQPTLAPEFTQHEDSLGTNEGVKSRTASPVGKSSKSKLEEELDSDATLPDPDSGHMWAAGDGFLERAKDLLDRTYANSRPSTCQALILMGYREIGIGAMAQSWLYIGMAVRMAQDLGMHRNSESWARDGEPIFSPIEQQIRKRIWYACVVMDKYVSAYIGRPLSIFEADYDTRLPSVEEDEEMELWAPNESMPNSILTDPIELVSAPVPPFPPVPGRIISCFNEAARLSSILAMIMQAIYAVNPVSSRHFEALQLERTLDRWYMDLPEYLRFDPNTRTSTIPPPNVLTLHMQYWGVVILLHRPFIPQYVAMHQKRLHPGSPVDQKAYSAAQKNFNLCVSAANHIATIVSIYQEHFCLKRCPVLLSYYIFTAGIMHITTMATNPNDPQAPLGLSKCMEVLKRIEVVWPSAGRAWELLHGAKDDLPYYELPLANKDRPRKRSADETVDTVTLGDPSHLHVNRLPALAGAQSFASAAANGQRYDPVVDITDGSHFFSLFNSYAPTRWPESDSSGTMGFPSGLSTSVLPQHYSTGFVEDRSVGSSHRALSTGPDGGGRYSQYWGDYSMGQPASMLSSMYDLPTLANAHAHGQQNQHASQAPPAQSFQSAPPLHMNDHYNSFNHLPPP